MSAETSGTEAAELDDVIEAGAGDGFEEAGGAVIGSFFRCLSRLISSVGSFVCLLGLITGLLLVDVDEAFASTLLGFSGASSLTLVSTMITGFSVIIGFIKGELPNVELFSTNALEIDILGRYSLSPSPPLDKPSNAGQANNLPTPPKLLANIFVLVLECVSELCSSLIRYGDVIGAEFEELDDAGEKAEELGSLALSSGHN